MVQLVLNLAHALVPGAFTRRIHTKVGHDTTFGGKLLQCLFPVLPVFCQKVLMKKRPMVFSGEIRGGNWYAVGGKSFLAELFRDAGADYFLKDDPRSGGVTLDFETVYSQAESADYWRIVNSYDGTFTYDALKSLDPRYADFRAFREKGVVYCNMREKPFYESMPMQPEIGRTGSDEAP